MKLTTDWSQGIFAIIRCRIFCLTVCNQTVWRL